MKVLITGGAGYIGTELVDALSVLPAASEIVVYDNLSRGNYNFFLGDRRKKNTMRFVAGDLLDSRKLRKELQGVDVVYHLAARVTTPFANIDSHFFEQINHWGTAELVYALEDCGVKKLIFTSSASVYGSNSIPAHEETPPHPTSFYGISKLRAEEQVIRLFEKMPAIIVRCGNVYGFSKSMRFDAVINRFMFDAHYTNRVTINGSGTQSRSFIHVGKLSQVLASLMVTDVPSGIYNLADKNLEVLDIVEALKQIYTGLEYFHINQHITMQELKVAPPEKLSAYVQLPHSELPEELKDFHHHFAFRHADASL